MKFLPPRCCKVFAWAMTSLRSKAENKINLVNQGVVQQKCQYLLNQRRLLQYRKLSFSKAFVGPLLSPTFRASFWSLLVWPCLRKLGGLWTIFPRFLPFTYGIHIFQQHVIRDHAIGTKLGHLEVDLVSLTVNLLFSREWISLPFAIKAKPRLRTFGSLIKTRHRNCNNKGCNLMRNFMPLVFKNRYRKI